MFRFNEKLKISLQRFESYINYEKYLKSSQAKHIFPLKVHLTIYIHNKLCQKLEKILIMVGTAKYIIFSFCENLMDLG